MLDKVTLMANTKDNDINLIINVNRLETYEKTDDCTKKIINNKTTKNFLGMYIQIDIAKGTIKIDGSLSKYLYHAENGIFVNHLQNFSISEIQKAIELLKQNTQIDIDKAQIHFAEIGLNLELPRPAPEYFNLIISIAPANKKEKILFMPNPIYKKDTVFTTIMHKDIRKHYKMYDKTAELQTKGKEVSENKYFMRIETVYKRKLNMTVAELMHPHTLKEILTEFKETWLSLEFERPLSFPKGTNTAKIGLCKELLQTKNAKTVLEKYRNQNKDNLLSDKVFRTIREFIEQKWNDFKSEIKSIPTANETEFKNALIIELSSLFD